MLEAFGLSDPGCVRSNNEDYFISDSEAGIFILADGMGGANAGEFASRISAEMLYEFLLAPAYQASAAADEQGPSDRVIPEQNFLALGLLEQGFVEANRAVRQAAKSDPALEGMGTTLLVARALNGAEVEVGSVGDSRAYIWSNGQLSQITQDQTWVAEVGSRLGLSEETLRKHPMRHVLTMAVGSAENLRVHSHLIKMGAGDQILLCSDGLHGVIDEKTFQITLDSSQSLPEKCHYLVEAAKQQGGPDNITVVLIQLV